MCYPKKVHVTRTILTKKRHRLRVRVRVAFPYTFAVHVVNLNLYAVAPRKTVKTADLRGGTAETLNMFKTSA